MNPLPCWRCGKLPDVDPNGGYPTVACSDCYDGAPDSSTRNDLGSGLNAAQAIAAWNEKAQQEEEDRRCFHGGVGGTCKNRGQDHFGGMCFFHRDQAVRL